MEMTTEERLNYLKRIQARILNLRDENARLCEEVEEAKVFEAYFVDDSQRSDYVTYFHDQQISWGAMTELEFTIMQVQSDLETEEQERAQKEAAQRKADEDAAKLIDDIPF